MNKTEKVALTISLFTQTILTLVALVRVFSIRMRFQRGKF